MLNCLVSCSDAAMNDLVQVSRDRLRRLAMLAVAGSKYGDHPDVRACAVSARDVAREIAEDFPRVFSVHLGIKNQELWRAIYDEAEASVDTMTTEDNR